MSIEKKPTPLQHKCLQVPIRKYIEKKYNVTVERNDTIGLKPPYIILGNHVNNWDPLFINCYVEETMSFVAAAPIFLNPTVKKALDFTGAISKTKGRADRSTIRDIIKAKKAGRIIGLFPEGNRSWNGHTAPLVYSTSKLIKLLNIPVVIATIKGGYLSQPRWSDTVRKGKTVVSLEKLWDENDIKDLTVEALHETLTDALAFSDLQWQQQSGIEFKGRRLANYLERHLYTCPNCKEIGHMQSEDDLFSCLQCGYSVRYNTKGSFEEQTGKLIFEHVYDWDCWQLTETASKLKDSNFRKLLNANLEDTVKVAESKNMMPYNWLGNFDLKWKNNGILLTQHSNNMSPLHIKFDEMEGVNVQMHHNLDFFYNDVFYRVQFVNPRSSAYMWYKLIEMNQSKPTEI
ncbi:MAG: lysophospholipid acyltransferase family protein [Lysinibacillus sp.]